MLWFRGGMSFVDKVLKVMFDDLPYKLTSKRQNYFSKINSISGIDRHPKIKWWLYKVEIKQFPFAVAWTEFEVTLTSGGRKNENVDMNIWKRRKRDVSVGSPACQRSVWYFVKTKRDILKYRWRYMYLRDNINSYCNMHMTRCQIWCTIEVHRDPISKVLSEW